MKKTIDWLYTLFKQIHKLINCTNNQITKYMTTERVGRVD